MLSTEFEKAAKERLSAIADKGFAMVLGLGAAGPRNAMTTYPVEWTSKYVQEGMMENDPVLAWMAQNSGHTRWADVGNTPEEIAQMKKANEFGLEYGTIISLFYAGEKISVSLCHTKPELTETEIREAGAALVVLAHLAPPDAMASPAAKELIYLRRVSEGLSDQEIADELNLSLRAVRERKKKAVSEMEANNIIHAVAKAKDAGFV